MKLSQGSASGSNFISRQSSVLDRVSPSSPSALTSLQNQVDQLTGEFVHQATEWRSLAAMMAGGVAYRFGRIGAMSLGSGPLARVASVGLGLTAEVSAFETTHRSLHSENPNLWKWAGTGGLRQGFFHSLITFGTLKLGGKLAQGQNLILQHGAQDLAMAAGHQLVYRAGIGPKPEGSFAEQMMHAEATNLQLGAGMGLGHMLMGGKLHAMERGLDLSVQMGPVGAAPRGRPQLEGTHMGVPLQGQPAFAMAGNLENRLREDTTLYIKGSDRRPSPPPSGGAGSGGSHRPPTYAELIRERLASLPSESIAEVEGVLLREWERWEGKETLEGSCHERIQNFLPQYARHALAHLGRETPAQLPFIPEAYEEATRSFGETEVTPTDRAHFIRFLATQEGRREAGLRNGESGLATLSLPGADFKKIRNSFGNTYDRWVKFLRTETESLALSPLQKAQVVQRGLNLFHFYGSYLFVKLGEALPSPFSKALFDAELIQRTLDDASRHPYPPETLALFERFFRETLGADTSGALGLKPKNSGGPETTALLSLQPLESAPLAYEAPLLGETWMSYLTRLGANRRTLLPKDWGLTGATVMKWGTLRDKKDRLSPPGDILHLLGVLTYLNHGGLRAMDPFDVLKLTLPEQTSHLSANARGEIVLRFPDLMADLDYAHFGLPNLLRAYLRTVPESHDMDLARQWGVSAATVRAYREGTTRKMHIENLQALAKSLLPREASESQVAEMENLLIFLRYRSYFDTTMVIEDQDGNPLNHRPPQTSRCRVILAPKGEELRPLDLTRRIRFEREPFASAINGTVDLALSLLEGRAEEFRWLGYDQIHLSDQSVSLPAFSERIGEYRDRHGDYFQRLSQQERSPGVVRPGELKEIQDFYREFFRFFEAVHLHARPLGEMKLGEVPIRFEVVPVTVEQPGGARVLTDPENSTGLRAYVVAADLFEKTRDLSPQDQGRMLQIRVMAAALQHFGLWVPGSLDHPTNRNMLRGALRANGLEISRDLLERFQTLPGLEGGGTVALDPSTEAVLHRITRGHLSQSARERRAHRLGSDLHSYLARHRLDPPLAAAVREAFGGYLLRVPHPFAEFLPERLEESLTPARILEGDRFAQEVRRHILRFMKGVGLPTETNRPHADARLTAEGLAQAAFASYLHAFQSLHPLRQGAARLLYDRALMERVIDDRLVDFAHLNPQREAILTELAKRIEAYNARTPALRVQELAREAETNGEPWNFSLFDLSFLSVLQNFQRRDPEVEARLSRPLIQASLRELRPTLAEGERPKPDEIRDAVESARARLKAMGIEDVDAELHIRFVNDLAENLEPRISAVRSLSALLPPFVGAQRIRSGLEGSSEIGAKAQEIFQRHLASALLDAQPLTLNEAILQVIGPRFDPYSAIREDVLRGMRAIHRESLLHLLNRYHEMEEALETAREEALQHREVERFREDFTALASVGDPALQNRGEVEARVADLEIFLGLFPFSPENRLSRRLAKVTAEIEALPKPSKPPPIDPASILAVPIPRERLETYPELELVTEEGVVQQIHRSQEEGRDFAKPEARELLQLLALLERYGQALPEVDLLTLEVRSSSEAEPIGDLTERAYRNYEVVRENLLGQIDPFDRIGLLAEIRGEGPRRNGLEAGKALQCLVSLRKLPPDLDRAFSAKLDEILESEAAISALRSHEPERIEEFLLLPYLTRVADLYLRNREQVLVASLRAPPEELMRPLQRGRVPFSLREKLEREAPELDLAPDELLFEILERDPVAMEGRDYLFEKLHLFHDRHFKDLPPGSAAEKATQEVNTVFDRIEVLMWAGAEYSPWNDRLMTVYRRHRPAFLTHLFETVGIERVMATLPELRGEEVKPVVIPSDRGEIFVARLRGFETAAKAANRMLALDLPASQRRNLEQVLWDFDPKGETFGNISSKIMRYYLNHREEFIDRPLRPMPQTWTSELDEIFRPYWELQMVEADAGKEAIDHVRNMIRVYNSSLSQKILTAHKGDQRISMVVTEEDQRSMEAAWKMGKGFPLPWAKGPWAEGREIPKPDTYHFRPYDPHLQMAYVREILASTRFLTLYSFFLNEHAKGLMPAVDRELDRSTALLLLGLDEGRAIPDFVRRVLRLYEKERNRVLNEMEFGPHVWKLPEVAGLPSHVLDVQGGSREYEPVELITRIASILNHLDPGALDILHRWEKEVNQGRSDIKKDIERSARFYLQHRDQILPHLTFTPEPPNPEKAAARLQVLIEEVSAYPELLALKQETVNNDLQHLFREGIAEKVEGIETLLRIGLMMDSVPETSPMRKKYRALVQKYISASDIPALVETTLSFYKTHRDEILAHRNTMN